jgi:hypothetical protein
MKNLTRVLSRLLAFSLASFSLVATAQAPTPHLGIFTGSTDIGSPKKGSTSYDPSTGNYAVVGGGQDLWGTADDFHFTWVKISGDATLEADVKFPTEDVVPKEKAMLIFRQSLDRNSAYADLAIHGDGHIALQYRKTAGGITEDVTATEHSSARLRMVRQGDHFTAYVGPSETAMKPVLSSTVALEGPIYVGLGVCSHNVDGVNTVIFSNIKITKGQLNAAGGASPRMLSTGKQL